MHDMHIHRQSTTGQMLHGEWRRSLRSPCLLLGPPLYQRQRLSLYLHLPPVPSPYLHLHLPPHTRLHLCLHLPIRPVSASCLCASTRALLELVCHLWLLNQHARLPASTPGPVTRRCGLWPALPSRRPAASRLLHPAPHCPVAFVLAFSGVWALSPCSPFLCACAFARLLVRLLVC